MKRGNPNVLQMPLLIFCLTRRGFTARSPEYTEKAKIPATPVGTPAATPTPTATPTAAALPAAWSTPVATPVQRGGGKESSTPSGYIPLIERMRATMDEVESEMGSQNARFKGKGTIKRTAQKVAYVYNAELLFVYIYNTYIHLCIPPKHSAVQHSNMANA